MTIISFCYIIRLLKQNEIKNEVKTLRFWLKNLRTKNNLKQNEIAKKLEISQGYYNLIETGERQKDLNLSLINKIAELFNVSVEYIVEQESKGQEV